MIVRPRINQETPQIAEKIICYLHYLYAHSDEHAHSEGGLYRHIPASSPRMFHIAIQKAIDNQWLWVSDEEDENGDEFLGYAIHQNGINVVEGWKDDKYNAVAEEIIFDFDQNANHPIPASDRTVTLNDNQREEASKTLEEVIQEFRKDHNFGNEWAAEKDVLLKALETGKEYLEAKVLDVRIGTMMIIEPLKNIADKYKDPAINGTFSALVQKAIEFFMDLFG